MLPVLFNIGEVPVSSFGLFLALALISSLFVVWRLAKAYEIDEERVSNIAILTFLGAIIGARILAVVFNLSIFDSWEKIVQINRYPGLSFWGGLIGGVTTFLGLTRSNKNNLWQLADFAGVGLLIGMVVGNLGCFLAGCGYGVISESIIATPVTGLVGKRLPVSLLESFILFVIFVYLWRRTIRFHFSGKIISLALIFLGLVKFISEYYRGDSRLVTESLPISYGHLLSFITLVLGVGLFYWRSKRSLALDLLAMVEVFYQPKRRTLLFTSVKKTWYNLTVSVRVRFGKTLRVLRSVTNLTKRKLNVKPTPEDFR